MGHDVEPHVRVLHPVALLELLLHVSALLPDERIRIGDECVGQFAHFSMQLVVGDVGVIVGVVAFPDDGDLVATGGQVAVNTVAGDIQFATDKPGGFTFVKIKFKDFVPGLFPVEKFCRLLGPELFGVFDRGFVHGLILFFGDMRLGGGFGTDRVLLDIKHGK